MKDSLQERYFTYEPLLRLYSLNTVTLNPAKICIPSKHFNMMLVLPKALKRFAVGMCIGASKMYYIILDYLPLIQVL